jgi:hypothetical protein
MHEICSPVKSNRFLTYVRQAAECSLSWVEANIFLSCALPGRPNATFVRQLDQYQHFIASPAYPGSYVRECMFA